MIPSNHNYCCAIALRMKQIFYLILILSTLIETIDSIQCDLARINCALRNGCGFSLQNYMMECTDLIAGRTQQCSPRCERALIGLISSDEGKDLINCDCNGNQYCELSKQRIEVCKKSVFNAIAEDTIVPCSTARWICISDQSCKTALEFYQINCRTLFKGHKCSYRCNNSLSILDRQEKAMKLRSCYCDGSETFPCRRIKFFTEKLCYGRVGHQSINNGDERFESENNAINPIGNDRIDDQSYTNDQHHLYHHHQQQQQHHRHHFLHTPDEMMIFDDDPDNYGYHYEANDSKSFALRSRSPSTILLLLASIFFLSILFTSKSR
ncbi:Growth arrest-specific protein 1 [Sarcoptes scabiei]|uniref:Growth arrest-specific protein 1 n=1 Tax=Sarcoptes scabiei TaxID=52283 RepID=A0A834RCU7_SARSC|nr:Growth arrest-specific protein 1 [Sarcoptes scabiei]